ncbi:MULTISPECIES: glycosyltransferase family 1 protein [unclassified Spirosoma]|uniref:glycosyltransferase family 4 protein n=1 Tax=unclassified Spirosoma TaxID=2621999 RepID=UPI0009637FC2|nr:MULTISPECIES: glycosyltransferase family 1 protein [unclassified Spirosoma]MBN8823211.1 glycosyltransferase family 4 protein [Spirosoma sp.]OJW72639.1 MAG: glycosyl transferase family 1 [Spirosoma sp. 48-14]
MPTLFIDTERLRDLNSGLGQVCLHLGQELVRQSPVEWQLMFLVPEGKTGIFGGSVSYIEASWTRKFWIPGQYDVWHCLHQDSAYLPSQAKLILTIHDLNFLERPDYSESTKARKLARLQKKVNRATALTAISQYTASVVREQLVTDKPVQVISNGVAVNPAETPTEPPKSAWIDSLVDAPFFLFVGVIHPKKNVHTLLPMLEAFPDYRLVLAGPDGHPYAQHIREQAVKLGIADRLLMPGSIDESTKRWLYAHCTAFLFPSLSEGFGLPVAEAMTFGKPVFISRLTSLPEVGGKEAYYFENFEPESMAQTLDEGLRDFAQNPLRQERLRRRAATFSWPDVAKTYWELYTGLVQ